MYACIQHYHIITLSKVCVCMCELSNYNNNNTYA